MSEITNVKFGKKFESVDITLTFEEARLLVYLRNRANPVKGGQFTPDRYAITMYKEDFVILNQLAEPLGRIV